MPQYTGLSVGIEDVVIDIREEYVSLPDASPDREEKQQEIEKSNLYRDFWCQVTKEIRKDAYRM
ncbi:MAG: hypothetical protein JEY71_14610 [Sphaerochaeta sp.]|nr:hypothetical protein [Sphaerochaeta sp.]